MKKKTPTPGVKTCRFNLTVIAAADCDENPKGVGHSDPFRVVSEALSNAPGIIVVDCSMVSKQISVDLPDPPAEWDDKGK